MDERIFGRVVVDKQVSCTFQGDCREVTLYDLSIDGCMIDAPDLVLSAGDILNVELKDEIVQEGQVVWERGGCAGIKFVVRLQPALVQFLGYKQPAPLFVDKLPFNRNGHRIPNLPAPALLL